jgi:hypothetical protein
VAVSKGIAADVFLEVLRGEWMQRVVLPDAVAAGDARGRAQRRVLQWFRGVCPHGFLENCPEARKCRTAVPFSSGGAAQQVAAFHKCAIAW